MSKYEALSEPAFPQKIDSLPGIIGHFQADSNFRTIHSTDDRTLQLSLQSEQHIRGLNEIAEKGGFGDVHKLSAFSPTAQYAFFSLQTVKSKPTRVITFGVLMLKAADAESILDQIKEVI